MVSLLFADDDRRVLSGLRRQLGDYRVDWDMSFVNGGPEAVALLPLVPFDAVVTDLRMPEVDGAQVLAEVARNQPEAARLVLSGHADASRRRLATNCAHRYLDKPCPPETLVLEIRQALAVREVVESLGDASLETLWARPPGILEGCVPVLAGLDGEDETLGPEVEALLARDGILWERVRGALVAAGGDALVGTATPAGMARAVGVQLVFSTILAVRFLQVFVSLDDALWGASVGSAARAVNGAPFSRQGAVESFVAGLLTPAVVGDGSPERLGVLAYLLPTWGFRGSVVDALTTGARPTDARLKRLIASE